MFYFAKAQALLKRSCIVLRSIVRTVFFAIFFTIVQYFVFIVLSECMNLFIRIGLAVSDLLIITIDYFDCVIFFKYRGYCTDS